MEHIHAIFEVDHLRHELLHAAFGLLYVCAKSAKHWESMLAAKGCFYNLTTQSDSNKALSFENFHLKSPVVPQGCFAEHVICQI